MNTVLPGVVVPECPLPWTWGHRAPVDDVGAQLASWLRQHGLTMIPAVEATVEHANPVLAATLGYPDARADRSALIAQWWTLILILDDRFDDWSHRAADNDEPLLEGLLSVFAPDGDAPECDTPILNACRDLWSRTRKLLTPAQSLLFAEHTRVHILSHRIEPTLAEIDYLTSHIDSYLEHRRTTIVIDFAIDLIEFALEFELPRHVREMSQFVSLRSAGGAIAGLTNDIYSWQREAEHQYPYNAVLILARNETLELQSAVNQVLLIIREQADLFAQAKRDILARSGVSERLLIAPWIGAYESLLRGFYEWHRLITRY